MPEISEEEQRKLEEKERKKAEVRKRLEEASKAKKTEGKKGGGFMTPERKKKLRVLLRAKAAEELKKEQERKAAKRRETIASRCGQAKPVDGANEASLLAICREYHSRILIVEGDKYDLEFQVRLKDYQVNELTCQVNDLRGKFVKPALKKVSKFDKIKIMTKTSADVDFRSGLKQVKKEFKELEDVAAKHDKPGWALGAKKETGETEAEE